MLKLQISDKSINNGEKYFFWLNPSIIKRRFRMTQFNVIIQLALASGNTSVLVPVYLIFTVLFYQVKI